MNRILKKALKCPLYLMLTGVSGRLKGLLIILSGTGRGNRTPMMSPSRDFESRASTNSAIPAINFVVLLTFSTQHVQLLLKTYRTASCVGE